MGKLHDEHSLRWVMRLSLEGYTTFVLEDERGERWGWIVNAGEFGWSAHVGDWGASVDGLVPLRQELMTMPSASEGRSFVEERIATQWKERTTP